MCYGLLFIIALLLVVVSFFVLIALKKTDSKKLKIFGYILAVLLWISVIFILVGHFYVMKMQSHKMMNDKSYHQMMPKK